jgi:hypothetical protein
VKRKLVRQSSGVYTITLPKDIIEAKGWSNAEFDIELENEKIILKKI